MISITLSDFQTVCFWIVISLPDVLLGFVSLWSMNSVKTLRSFMFSWTADAWGFSLSAGWPDRPYRGRGLSLKTFCGCHRPRTLPGRRTASRSPSTE